MVLNIKYLFSLLLNRKPKDFYLSDTSKMYIVKKLSPEKDLRRINPDIDVGNL